MSRFLSLLALLLLALPLATLAAPTASATCSGQTVTVDGQTVAWVVVGTPAPGPICVTRVVVYECSVVTDPTPGLVCSSTPLVDL